MVCGDLPISGFIGVFVGYDTPQHRVFHEMVVFFMAQVGLGRGLTFGFMGNITN